MRSVALVTGVSYSFLRFENLPECFGEPVVGVAGFALVMVGH